MADIGRTDLEATELRGETSSHSIMPSRAIVGFIASRPIVATFVPGVLLGVDFDAVPEAELVEPPAFLVEPFARYLRGEPEDFASVRIFVEGTEFQCRVWEALRTIRWGEVASYGAIAARVGSPRGMRAVGMANGRNKIAIVVPCHRVVESTGALGGFTGGLDVKRELLALEGTSLVRDKVQGRQLALF